MRDISAEEIIFLVINRKYSRIIFDGKPLNDNELSVSPNSSEGVLISGLVSLGLLVPGTENFDEIGRYRFSPLADKVLEVINSKQLNKLN